MSLDWKEKLNIITETKSSYQLTEEERNDLKGKVLGIIFQLEAVLKTTDELEWLTPAIQEHINNIFSMIQEETNKINEILESIT